MRSTEPNECKHKTTCQNHDKPRNNYRTYGHLSTKHQYCRYNKHKKIGFVIVALESSKTIFMYVQR